MSESNKTDFSVYRNRANITDEFMHMDNKELVSNFIRVLAFMETIAFHPDRQAFWEYLEKIVSQNRSAQMVLDQLVTVDCSATPNTNTEKTVDRHLNKV